MMFAGAAQATELACWTFEFIPGQHVPDSELGEIQNGHTYYSDAFEWPQGFDQASLAEVFEAHVRRTAPPLGAGSTYVSGCQMSGPYGGAQTNAAMAHGRFLHETTGRSTNLHWTPGAADLAKAPPPLGADDLLFYQCLTTPGSLRFNELADFNMSPVFRIKVSDGNDVRQQFSDYVAANKLDGSPRCLAARTREGLEAQATDEIDHARPGSRIVKIEFKPAAAVATKPIPPKPANKSGAQTAALTVKTDTSLRDAGKAWDEQVRKTLAAEAQKKVETAAKAAQADARMQAEIAAFFAERRKQGRAQ